MSQPQRPYLLPHRLALLPAVALLAGLWAGVARAGCVDEDRPDPGSAAASGAKAGAAAAAAPAATFSAQPEAQLKTLVGEVLMRSQGVGSARMLAEAAQIDVDEAVAAKLPQAALTGSIGPNVNMGTDGNTTQLQVRAGLTISQTLFDGGRSDRMIDWRRQQAEVARLGALTTQEQLTLSATSLAFERSRYRMQAVVYGQHVRKMACLVEALDSIVATDKGRLSELVQARKQQQQAELQQAQAVSQARQVEAKLRRMAGDGLPATDGLATLMLTVPPLPELLASAERSTEIGQLDAAANAAREMARVTEAGTKPQVSWSVGGSTNLSAGTQPPGGVASPHNAGVNASVMLSIPLLNPAIDHSIQAARRRAAASVLQRADVLEQRRQRVVEVHEQATAAFERVRMVSLVLRDSDRLRNFTLQQWQQLGRRSLFDVMAAEGDHYALRVQYINALHDGQQLNATLWSLGGGLSEWLRITP